MRSARGVWRDWRGGGGGVEEAHGAVGRHRSVFSCALAGGFVEEDAAGDGGVEAFDPAGAGDGDALVARRSQSSGRPAPSLPMRRAVGLGEVGLGDGGRRRL